MKAIVYDRYGSPDVLEMTEIDKPLPKDDEVLLKLHAASVNSWDLEFLQGIFLIRLGAPFRPQYRILGADVAGEVAAIGKNVTQFQVGDAVLGDISGCGCGGFAEYVCAKENVLVKKPAMLSFVEAAAIPQAGVLALQGLRNHKPIEAGQKVLINGAGGGAGTFAVQLAKYFGAEVTGVDRASKLAMLTELGADHVMDYAKTDFTKTGQVYDFVLDMVCNRSIADCRRALSPHGIYVVVGGTTGSIFQTGLFGNTFVEAGTKRIELLMGKPNPSDLLFLISLLEAGKITPIIDRTYPLNETPVALRYMATGQVKGKIVITMQ